VRAEVLGALINSVFLVALCFEIIMEAIHRLLESEPVKNENMLLIAGIIGLVINVVGLIIFGHGHAHNVEKAIELEHGKNDIIDIDDDQIEEENRTGTTGTPIIAPIKGENEVQEKNELMSSSKPKTNRSHSHSHSHSSNEKKRKSRCCNILSKKSLDFLFLIVSL
jgi:solute carrier family 30 (zinc transporter), member 1